MKRIAKLTFLTFFCALLSGCATKMTVMAGLSENIKDYYSIYPSVEIDVAAVTEEEAEELKKYNADSYFSVGNAMRKSLTPYTFTFSSEQTAPQTMKYNVPQCTSRGSTWRMVPWESFSSPCGFSRIPWYFRLSLAYIT